VPDAKPKADPARTAQSRITSLAYDKGRWTNPLRGSHDFGRGSDFAGWVGDKHPRLPLAGQLNRETMTWRHVALFVSQRSCQ